jgi:hypothetical protein
MIIARTDTSAKFYKQPEQGFNTGNYNVIGYEFQKTAAGGGYLADPLRCRAGATGYFYQSFFRPDSEYNYGFGNTSMAKDCFTP